MTRTDLIQDVSRVLELPLKDGELIVETIFSGIVRALRQDGRVEIRGFGSFGPRKRQPRIARNPKSGARVEVPAKTVPYFKASKELRERINTSMAIPVTASDSAQTMLRRVRADKQSVS